MAENKQDDPIALGIFSRKQTAEGISPADIIALVLSLMWLAASGLFFAFARFGGGLSFDPLTFVMTLLAVAMPVALIWIGASAAKSAKIMREESARLQASIDAMRQAYIQQQQQHAASAGMKPSVEEKLDELMAAQKQAESAMATFATTRPPAAAPLRPAHPANGREDQPSLALGTPAEELGPAMSVADFVRALNFPETAEDAEGFRVLRLALQDHRTAKLVRAAQDVLTLLSEDGIYMDDLAPDRARPEIWRKFAAGERGPAIAALGGVRDRSCLALSAGRMRQDPIFRDAAHHFLRQFDRSFAEFEKTASDQDISHLAETRTARAFMLLGRVTGMFD
ncbi:hypothetical protein Ga0609869_001222 [Rhodovulum iodosum]|uniref:Uncharacterized protein n=1 Tax=Rhodovulum iodosum TaxID=68291 RepID=A0ABV3XRP3_9RHOB|nr:hypothetical protein [Rhodovulum robiginosum]RSK32719.1 hypothetical protein EJA01_10285 [Rhodovulum robiginosum]